MRLSITSPTRLRFAARSLAAAAAAALVACSDAATPLAPASGGPSTAANTTGPLAVTSVIGLEPLLGAVENVSRASDISDLGQVVGASSTPDGHTHAVVWEPNVSPFPIDLGTLPVPGGTDSHANAISADGAVIVGQSGTASGKPHAVRWVKVNGAWIALDLGTLDGGDESEAFDVNERGAIVGRSNTGTPGFSHGFLWQNGTMTDLHPTFTIATALNGSGQVVGYSVDNPQAVTQARLWTLAGGAVELGSGVPAAINGSGEVVGGTGIHAFLWTRKKGMVDLGTLGGSFSDARDISATGQVVGRSTTSAGQDHAFLWARGKMLDLGVLPGYEGGVSIANAINGSGQIVGTSSLVQASPQVSRATLWTVK